MSALTLLALALQVSAGPRPPQPDTVPVPLAYVPSMIGMDPLQWDGGDTELEFGDTNNDGHLDLVSVGDHGNPFVNTNQHGVITFFGDGTGRWGLQQTGNFGYGGIAVGDVNNDGALDVGYGVHHDYSATDLGDQLLEVALGDGSGLSWVPWDDGLATNGETWGMFATDFADVDGDGWLDVASNSFGCCAGVHVYRNQQDGTWVQTFGFTGGNSDPFLDFGDVNGDGYPDFAVANDAGNVYLGDGSGGFVNADANLPGSAATRSAFSLGDVDGDGRDELAFVPSGAGPQVWSYDGTVWFDVSSGLPDSTRFKMVELADMDADGFLDVVALGTDGFAVWRGDGTGTWSLAAAVPVVSGAAPVTLRTGGDVDHNGRPDVAFVQDESCGLFCSQNQLYFYREASTPTRLGVTLASPRGAVVWREGSARTVKWYAAVPGGAAATADVQLSISGAGGPWSSLASSVPNDGVQQVAVPTGISSTDCFLRVVVRSGGQTAIARSPVAFSILP